MKNIRIILTVQELKTAGACDSGITCFQRLFGEEAKIFWNPMNELLVRKDPELKKFFQWLLNKQLISSFSFSCMQLDSVDLHNAHVDNIDFRSANLSNAYLRNTNLSNANLYNVDLYNANLYNANLYNANLNDAYLSNANLCNAIYNKYTIFPDNFEIPKTMILVE